MVQARAVAVCLLIASAPGYGNEYPMEVPSRSLFGKKINKADQIRVQGARLNRLEERIHKMSEESAFLAERSRQHREMRVKGSSELRERVNELEARLHSERERMQKDFENQLMAVREEMWAQASRDREALEAEIGLRYEGDRERMLQEANERAHELLEEVKAKMTAEAERDRELYAQRAALAEEGQELAREDRNNVLAEREELERRLRDITEIEDCNRKKIILKFKARENTLRKNFEAQLKEARAVAAAEPPAGGEQGATGVGDASLRNSPKWSRPTASELSSTTSASYRDVAQRAAVKTGGVTPSGGTSIPSSHSAAATPQR